MAETASADREIRLTTGAVPDWFILSGGISASDHQDREREWTKEEGVNAPLTEVTVAVSEKTPVEQTAPDVVSVIRSHRSIVCVAPCPVRNRTSEEINRSG